MEKVMKFIKKYYLTILGMIIGSVGGFAYYYFVGCADNSCPITSSPYMSTIYGAVMGGLLFDIFRKKEKK